MAEPLRRDLVARRNAPLAYEWSFTDDAGDPVDFTGATVTMQVRQYGAQAGSALISLVEVAEATPPTEGLQAADGTISVAIDESTLLFLPTGKEGAVVVFEYDLVVELSGAVPEVWAYGSLTVKPGVTDRINFLTVSADNYLVRDSGPYLTAG